MRKLPYLENKMLNKLSSVGKLDSANVSSKERAALNRLAKKGVINRQPWQRCFGFLAESDNTMINKYVYFI